MVRTQCTTAGAMDQIPGQRTNPYDTVKKKKKHRKSARKKNQFTKHPGLFPGVGQASQVVLGLFMGLMFPQQGNMASEVYRETAIPIKHLITYSY